MDNISKTTSSKINVRIENKIENGVETKMAYEVAKRIFDLILSIISLVILSPILLLIIVVIKLDSKGPVFFKHKRVGRFGKSIDVYKFRTMVINAEEILAKLSEEQKKEFEDNFKLEDDPRITKIGSFLRKTSLDELPQLINIMQGNMSFVGPRPVVEKELQKYGKSCSKFLSVVPGLTGYWQCNGRSNTTYEERVKMDMHYIDNRSFLMDLKIIFKTFAVVFKGDGAM